VQRSHGVYGCVLHDDADGLLDFTGALGQWHAALSGGRLVLVGDLVRKVLDVLDLPSAFERTDRTPQ
jgi:hypothetical protein